MLKEEMYVYTSGVVSVICVCCYNFNCVNNNVHIAIAIVNIYKFSHSTTVFHIQTQNTRIHSINFLSHANRVATSAVGYDSKYISVSQSNAQNLSIL